MEKDDKLRTADKAQWLALRDRYFEVETTDEEERLLRRFAATALAQDDPDFADLCAVMSIVAVGKAASSKRQNEMKRRRMRWVWAAAACVAGLVLVMLAWPSKNVCVAYVDGVKITDRDEVLALMHDSWDDIALDADANTVETQLTDLFNTIE
jgi:hypothetical protein